MNSEFGIRNAGPAPGRRDACPTKLPGGLVGQGSRLPGAHRERDRMLLSVHLLDEIGVGFGHGPPLDLHGRCDLSVFLIEFLWKDSESLDLFHPGQCFVDLIDLALHDEEKTRKLAIEISNGYSDELSEYFSKPFKGFS